MDARIALRGLFRPMPSANTLWFIPGTEHHCIGAPFALSPHLGRMLSSFTSVHMLKISHCCASSATCSSRTATCTRPTSAPMPRNGHCSVPCVPKPSNTKKPSMPTWRHTNNSSGRMFHPPIGSVKNLGWLLLVDQFTSNCVCPVCPQQTYDNVNKRF